MVQVSGIRGLVAGSGKENGNYKSGFRVERFCLLSLGLGFLGLMMVSRE